MPGEVIGHVREPNIVLEVWWFFLIFLFLVVYVVIVVAAVEQMYQSSYKMMFIPIG